MTLIHKTRLSVNLNKIALLRNARGHNSPDLCSFAYKAIRAGADGITLHPRPDGRHILPADVSLVSDMRRDFPKLELNLEGYPCEQWLQLAIATKPDQCTLVPDAPHQLTSDHGWQISAHKSFLRPIIQELQKQHIRVSLFVEPELQKIQEAKQIGVERVELFTEAWAKAWNGPAQPATLKQYQEAATQAQQLGLGVNAGHDLNLQNLPLFLQKVPGIAEVSVGHALIVESLLGGFESVVKQYAGICGY